MIDRNNTELLQAMVYQSDKSLIPLVEEISSLLNEYSNYFIRQDEIVTYNNIQEGEGEINVSLVNENLIDEQNHTKSSYQEVSFKNLFEAVKTENFNTDTHSVPLVDNIIKKLDELEIKLEGQIQSLSYALKPKRPDLNTIDRISCVIALALELSLDSISALNGTHEIRFRVWILYLSIEKLKKSIRLVDQATEKDSIKNIPLKLLRTALYDITGVAIISNIELGQVDTASRMLAQNINLSYLPLLHSKEALKYNKAILRTHLAEIALLNENYVQVEKILTEAKNLFLKCNNQHRYNYRYKKVCLAMSEYYVHHHRHIDAIKICKLGLEVILPEYEEITKSLEDNLKNSSLKHIEEVEKFTGNQVTNTTFDRGKNRLILKISSSAADNIEIKGVFEQALDALNKPELRKAIILDQLFIDIFTLDSDTYQKLLSIIDKIIENRNKKSIVPEIADIKPPTTHNDIVTTPPEKEQINSISATTDGSSKYLYDSEEVSSSKKDNNNSKIKKIKHKTAENLSVETLRANSKEVKNTSTIMPEVVPTFDTRPLDIKIYEIREDYKHARIWAFYNRKAAPNIPDEVHDLYEKTLEANGDGLRKVKGMKFSYKLRSSSHDPRMFSTIKEIKATEDMKYYLLGFDLGAKNHKKQEKIYQAINKKR